MRSFARDSDVTTSPDTERLAARWLSRLGRMPRFAMGLALALPLLAGALLVWQALVLSGIVHDAVIGGVAPAALAAPVALFGTIYVVRIALVSAGEMFAVRASETIKQLLRGRLVGDMLGRQPVWSAGRSSGALAGLVVEQAEAVDGFFARYMPAMIQAAILPVAFAAVAFSVDWVIGLLFLVTAPLIPVFMALAGWGAQAATDAQAEALTRLGGRFADRLRGLVTLKLFGREAAETAAVRAASEDLRGRTMRVMGIAFLSSAVLEFFAALGVAGVALYVGLTFLELIALRGTELTLAGGLFCLLMAPEVYQPLRLLAANYHDRAAAKSAALEIAAQLGHLPEAAAQAAADGEPAPVPAPVGGAAVELEDVSVATPAGRVVVSGVRLSLAPGSRTALLGPSGCGKSTLIEALARLRDAGGSIRLDGRELAAIPEAELRAAIAFLGQRPRIFAGTIADNIRLGRPAASDSEVAEAASRAAVDHFAAGLAAGLDTPIGENGLGLSGGEVQRVALARLYLRDPRLILMDEPTAHLDAATEAAVLDGLMDFARGRTLVVATHSPAVAARMAQVHRIAGQRLVAGLKPGTRSSVTSPKEEVAA